MKTIEERAIKWNIDHPASVMYGKPLRYKDMHSHSLLAYVAGATDQEEITKRECIDFGRWLLKHTNTHTTEEGMFTWSFPNGETIDTVEIYEQFKKENP